MMKQKGREQRAVKSKAISVGLISLGCAKNLVDSQVMAGSLLKHGMAFVPDPSEADVVIINTCAFIEDAREESRETILSICELKAEGVCKAVLVAGCMSQRYRDDMHTLFPDVDAFIGLDELEETGRIAERIINDKGSVIVAVSDQVSKLYEPEFPELVLTGGPYAYLKVAEGCNHQCAFCAIPGIRGARRSRSMESILFEAAVLLKSGIKELDIIAQDIMAYGKDLKGRVDLPTLLKELVSLGDDCWIRLLYGYPTGVTDDLLAVMAENPVICRYFDIPIQHSHPDILKAMRRAETADKLEDMIFRIRGALPGVTLRTTCLVGFPGEEEEHFGHLMDFVKRMEFDHLGVFIYSPEKNTKAYNLKNVPERVLAEERRHELMLAQREIVDRKAQALLGMVADVLVERDDPEDKSVMIGRSERFAPEIDGEVFIKGSAQEDIGKFIKVRYIEQLDYDLLGEKI